jgi:hypothetical protein
LLLWWWWCWWAAGGCVLGLPLPVCWSAIGVGVLLSGVTVDAGDC